MGGGIPAHSIRFANGDTLHLGRFRSDEGASLWRRAADITTLPDRTLTGSGERVRQPPDISRQTDFVQADHVSWTSDGRTRSAGDIKTGNRHNSRTCLDLEGSRGRALLPFHGEERPLEGGFDALGHPKTQGRVIHQLKPFDGAFCQGDGLGGKQIGTADDHFGAGFQ